MQPATQAPPRSIRRHAIFQRGPWHVGRAAASADVLSEVDFSAGAELGPLEAKAIAQDLVLEFSRDWIEALMYTLKGRQLDRQIDRYVIYPF